MDGQMCYSKIRATSKRKRRLVMLRSARVIALCQCVSARSLKGPSFGLSSWEKPSWLLRDLGFYVGYERAASGSCVYQKHQHVSGPLKKAVSHGPTSRTLPVKASTMCGPCFSCVRSSSRLVAAVRASAQTKSIAQRRTTGRGAV